MGFYEERGPANIKRARSTIEHNFGFNLLQRSYTRHELRNHSRRSYWFVSKVCCSIVFSALPWPKSVQRTLSHFITIPLYEL